MTLANAAAAADTANGEKLAKRWCAACHVVASDQQQRQYASGAVLGHRQGRRASMPPSSRCYLLLPHPKMPDMNMSRAEAADLAAYIAAQGK